MPENCFHHDAAAYSYKQKMRRLSRSRSRHQRRRHSSSSISYSRNNILKDKDEKYFRRNHQPQQTSRSFKPQQNHEEYAWQNDGTCRNGGWHKDDEDDEYYRRSHARRHNYYDADDCRRRRRCSSSVPSRRERQRYRDRSGSRQSPRFPSPSRSRSENRSPSPPRDKEGYMVMQTDRLINARYQVIRVLGEGTFGRVVECDDLKRRPRQQYSSTKSESAPSRVAIKVIKAIEKYRDAAELEIDVLNCFKKLDPNGDFLCVRLCDYFDYHGHVCLVFDMLGLSVFDWLKENDYIGYPMEQLCYMAYQLCYATKFLHDCGLTHTDLKPENILFVNSAEYSIQWNTRLAKSEKILDDATIRLIDFGSATWDEEHHTKVVSTRHYRAPEVVMELGWDHTCDIWSIGCILLELYTGSTLFMTHDNLEHLAMMERVLGALPSRMVRRSRKDKYFRHGRLAWDTESSDGRYVRKHVKRLHDYCLAPGDAQHEHLLDLIRRMLTYAPEHRITLHQALRHPFFDFLPERLRLNNFRNSSPFARDCFQRRNSACKNASSRSRSNTRYSRTGRAR